MFFKLKDTYEEYAWFSRDNPIRGENDRKVVSYDFALHKINNF